MCSRLKQNVIVLAIVAAAGSFLSLRQCRGGEYPSRVEEGFFSLFDGQTFLNYEGETESFACERNPVVGYMNSGATFRSDANAMRCCLKDEGSSRTIFTKEAYGDFILRFSYWTGTNACGCVGLRALAGSAESGKGISVALADDWSLASESYPSDRYAGSIIGVVASRRERNERINDRETGNTYAKPTCNWNFVEIRAVGSVISVYLNGEKVAEKKDVENVGCGRVCFTVFAGEVKWLRPRIRRVSSSWRGDPSESAPDGFTELFDGCSLAGWKGVTREEEFDRPWVRQKATDVKRAEMQAKADVLMRKFWHVRDGVLFFDGKRGGYNLATVKEYGNFELWCDWRLLSVRGDSGLYPRGVCQIQIWDAHDMFHLGSGGLYNNAKNPRHAMEIADNPAGDWNRFHVKMVGDRVTVWLNGRMVVENTVLENAKAARFPGPIPTREQLELQCHGDPLEFRNIFIKELP